MGQMAKAISCIYIANVLPTLAKMICFVIKCFPQWLLHIRKEAEVTWIEINVQDPRAARPYLFSNEQNMYNRVVLVCTMKLAGMNTFNSQPEIPFFLNL